VSGSIRASLDNGSASRSAFGQKIERGDNVLIPFIGAFTFSAETTAIVLVTENFS